MTDVNALAKLAAKRAKDTLGDVVTAATTLATATADEVDAKARQTAARNQLRKAVTAATALGFTPTDLENLGVDLATIGGRPKATATPVSDKPEPPNSQTTSPA